MPNGSFWVGKGGFNYKRSGGAGNRRNFSIGAITNQPADVNNTYVSGAGVGASSIATRRAKLNHATRCSAEYPCNKAFSRLGLYSSGGSNQFAFNWFLGAQNVPFYPATDIVASLQSISDVTVSFITPKLSETGGTTIIGYIVVSSPGNITAIGQSSPITVSGLKPGTTYTFTVRTMNATGKTVDSNSSNPVTTPVVPNSPTNVSSGQGGVGQAIVSFSAPSYNGGSPITGYTVVFSPGNIRATGPSSPITVSGLTPGASYTFTVVATNAVGDSNPSTGSITLSPAAPNSPTNVSSAPGGIGEAIVTFSAPAFNGGSPITGYSVVSNPGNITVTGLSSPITISGLTYGVSYTFTVVAINTVGVSPTSSSSNPTIVLYYSRPILFQPYGGSSNTTFLNNNYQLNMAANQNNDYSVYISLTNVEPNTYNFGTSTLTLKVSNLNIPTGSNVFFFYRTFDATYNNYRYVNQPITTNGINTFTITSTYNPPAINYQQIGVNIVSSVSSSSATTCNIDGAYVSYTIPYVTTSYPTTILPSIYNQNTGQGSTSVPGQIYTISQGSGSDISYYKDFTPYYFGTCTLTLNVSNLSIPGGGSVRFFYKRFTQGYSNFLGQTTQNIISNGVNTFTVTSLFGSGGVYQQQIGIEVFGVSSPVTITLNNPATIAYNIPPQ